MINENFLNCKISNAEELKNSENLNKIIELNNIENIEKYINDEEKMHLNINKPKKNSEDFEHDYENNIDSELINLETIEKKIKRYSSTNIIKSKLNSSSSIEIFKEEKLKKEKYKSNPNLNPNLNVIIDKTIESLNKIEKTHDENLSNNLCNLSTSLKNNIPGENFNKLERLNVYCVTWNMYGKAASQGEIKNLLPKFNKEGEKYHIYALGTEECMRSILFSFFYNDKSAWERVAQ